VAEWPIAAVLKTVVPKGTVSSNLTLSAIRRSLLRRLCSWQATHDAGCGECPELVEEHIARPEPPITCPNGGVPVVFIGNMKLSVVIPVFNEKDTVHELLREVSSVDVGLEKEIVIVDDCSTDGTRDVLTKTKNEHPDWKFVFHEKNRGKGAALRSGFAVATGNIVVIQDADLEYDPRDYPALLGPILDGHADVVYGSRFLGGGPHRVVFFWHSIGNRFLTTFSNMMTDLNLTDMEVCYKVFKKEVLGSIELKENRFGFEVEVTAKIARGKKWRIYEVPIRYYGRNYAEGKKITWRDGVRAIWCIIKYRFV
jgi:glycosyltransferase involved in cell wall biosynthesis